MKVGSGTAGPGTSLLAPFVLALAWAEQQPGQGWRTAVLTTNDGSIVALGPVGAPPRVFPGHRLLARLPPDVSRAQFTRWIRQRDLGEIWGGFTGG